ncbi:Retrovirus-related Pol poly from type-1 retrotransposable element R2 [Labeo rohita]|uniref:Retrovirus-related Pol poly from type-1 retrotransposable element R2 n=1 Tax=Labeo rohita TaxID=84645 RepID=A0A498NQ49_LABRO|nr:Retrovirus-related Pol poly from type-1 retrotransposable element R2 [Labeo rohita]
MSELESVTIKDRRRLKNVRRSKELDQNIELVNQALVNITNEYSLNITELNTLQYAAAVIADDMRDTPKGGIGYAADNKNIVTHLLCMDDLKIFGRDEKQLRQAMHIIKMFSDDIQMEFGQDKCTTVVFKRGV